VRLFVYLTIALLCGCRSKSGADASVSPEWLEGRLPAEHSEPVDGGALTVRVMNEPAGLNALDDSCRDAWVLRITRGLVLDALLEIAPDGTLRPELAASWNDSEDHHTTTFTLRDATFSDGKKLTSADVIATFDALMNAKHPTAGLRGEFSGLSEWKAVDEKTVKLTWSRPSPFTLRTLSRLPIFSAAQLAGEWSETLSKPIGTGPFVLEKWERGQSLTLKRREGGRAYLDTITFRFVKDQTAGFTMMERGEFDLMTALTPALWRSLESQRWAQSGWNRIKSPDNSYSYIAWNESKPEFADVRVRRALASLYDAKLISKIVDLDLELPTSCPYLRGSSSCDSTVQPIAFSPSEAKALLTDAAVSPEKPLRFHMLMPGSSQRLAKLVPILQEQMKPLGVEMEIEKVETTVLSSRVAKRDFEAVSRLWTEFDTEQDVFPMFHSSQIAGGDNWVGYSNPEVDTLIEQVRGEFDADKRHALQRQLHARLYADQPYLFMTSRQSLDASKTRVHGLAPSVSWYDLRVVWVAR
jgi:peptide/nickel transport system substrate-binding protein